MNVTVDETTPSAIRNEARINPRNGKPAGKAELSLLLAASCLSVLGAVLLAPSLPAMAAYFADTPGVATLVPLSLTIPALFIALLAPIAGRLVDKLGRKRVLIIALFLYAVVGTAPLWLGSLGGILISRALVGIAEAFIMTCCTTLIADYFLGSRRAKYLGLQAVFTTIAATIFLALGGVLGSVGWRAPFWLYAVSVVLAVGMMIVIWPTRQTSKGGEKRADKLPPMHWKTLLAPLLVSVFGGIAFYALIVELSFLLSERGVTDTAAIGAPSAISSLATAIGAFAFQWFASRGARVLLTLAFGLIGAGYVVILLAPSIPVLMLGAVIGGFGGGVLLPTLITWALSGLPYDLRGRGTGAWTSAIFFGEFLCPLLIASLTTVTASLSTAVGIVGIASIVVAAIVAATVRSARPLVVTDH